MSQNGVTPHQITQCPSVRLLRTRLRGGEEPCASLHSHRAGFHKLDDVLSVTHPTSGDDRYIGYRTCFGDCLGELFYRGPNAVGRILPLHKCAVPTRS